MRTSAILVAVVIVVTGCAAGNGPVPVLQTPFADAETLQRAATLLDEAKITFTVDEDNRIFVVDEEAARRARTLLIRGLVVRINESLQGLIDTAR